MRVIALETSTEYCSAAVWHDGVIAERSVLAGQRHSELLIEMLDAVLADAGFGIRDMHGVAFGKGPGSFTGVRIACGAAQGLAFGTEIPVVGICSLEALAQASGKSRVIAALDARMGEIYHAAYEKRGEAWVAVSGPCLCKPEAAPQLPEGEWFGAGSGFATHGQALRQRYARQLQDVDAAAVPQAAAIATLGAAQLKIGRGVDAAEALPLYLRDKVAQKTSERDLH